MLTETVSWPELLWTIVTLIGLVFCTKLALRATFELVSLRARRINSIREYAAITTMIAFMSWTGCLSVFLVIGITLMIAENHEGVTVISIIIFIMAACGTAMLSWAAYTVDRRRAELTRKILEIEKDI